MNSRGAINLEIKDHHIREKFKCEVVWCAKEKRHHKATAIFGVDESNV
jgi:hypothetical protein